jgi:hypothetical protein
MGLMDGTHVIMKKFLALKEMWDREEELVVSALPAHPCRSIHAISSSHKRCHFPEVNLEQHKFRYS